MSAVRIRARPGQATPPTASRTVTFSRGLPVATSRAGAGRDASTSDAAVWRRRRRCTTWPSSPSGCPSSIRSTWGDESPRLRPSSLRSRPWPTPGCPFSGAEPGSHRAKRGEPRAAGLTDRRSGATACSGAPRPGGPPTPAGRARRPDTTPPPPAQGALREAAQPVRIVCIALTAGGSLAWRSSWRSSTWRSPTVCTL